MRDIEVEMSPQPDFSSLPSPELLGFYISLESASAEKSVRLAAARRLLRTRTLGFLSFC